MRTTAGFVVATVLGASCYSYTEPKYGSPADVVLAVGGDVQVDAVLQVVFLGVPADSRCPATADCITPGDAAVVLGVSLGTGPTVTDTLHTNQGLRAASAGGYIITLLTLTPYPQIPGPIPTDQYRARLSISLAPITVGG